MQKHALRAEMLARRGNLNPQFIDQAEAAMIPQVLAVPEVKAAPVVGLYWSFPQEMPTHQLFSRLKGAGKRLGLPRMTSREGAIDFAELEDPRSLELGPWKVLQPALSQPAIPLSSMSVLIIPGVAFDRKGRRMGWGKGFYDRLLEKYEGYRLGLAFEFQLLEGIPQDPWDQSVHAIITEKDFYSCRKWQE